MLACYRQAVKRYEQIIFGVLMVSIVLAAYHVHVSAHSAGFHTVVTNPTVKAKPQPVTSTHTTVSSTTNSQSLPTVIADMNSAMVGYSDLSAAATLIDLNTGQEYDAGATSTIFKAASCAKVLTAVVYLHDVEQGQYTLSQNIDGYGTAQQLIQEMIEVSDNTAWNDLEGLLGNQEQTYASSIGMNTYTGNGYNTMTAADEAKLLAQLAQGKLLNSSDQALLYSFMANTDDTDLIPAALPSSATVYNKYGELWGYLNDAAIVNYNSHNFVLVVFTNNPDGTTDESDDQTSLIHAVTAAAFQDINQ